MLGLTWNIKQLDNHNLSEISHTARSCCCNTLITAAYLLEAHFIVLGQLKDCLQTGVKSSLVADNFKPENHKCDSLNQV